MVPKDTTPPAPEVEETAPEVLDETPEEEQPGDAAPSDVPPEGGSDDEATDDPPADETGSDDVPPPSDDEVCPLCFPNGKPEGALTVGCEHSA